MSAGLFRCVARPQEHAFIPVALGHTNVAIGVRNPTEVVVRDGPRYPRLRGELSVDACADFGEVHGVEEFLTSLSGESGAKMLVGQIDEWPRLLRRHRSGRGPEYGVGLPRA